MLLDQPASSCHFHADVVDIEVVACRHSTHAVENIFGTTGAGDGLYRDVSAGKDCLYDCLNLFHQLAGALKGDIAREGDRKIGKITVASTADAHPINCHNAID